jgi:uncharacterized protein (DUF305 family)
MDRVRQLIWRLGVIVLVLAVFSAEGRSAADAQQSTPAAAYSCDDATPAASPEPSMGGMAEMDMGTPMAGMEMEFDQLYIDMMIPHHASIVALAQAALPRLSDERLQAIAQSIIEAQSAEIEELSGDREQFYGSPEPMPMDTQMMGMMAEQMPGMGSMDEMATQMNPEAQVAAFCGAADPDLAFIDLVIPHHEMAIAASQAAQDRATHDEIRAFAERVIADQRREIEELQAIRDELTDGASPAAGGEGGPVSDQAGLIRELQARGVTVDIAGNLDPDVPFAGASAGTVLLLSGDRLVTPVELQAYEYDDPGAAAADAGQITPDGNTATAMITWIGPPHFFRGGRLIALYVGEEPAVIALLTEILGSQFAGQ